MTNFDLSLEVFSILKQAGVENLIVCAGARNAPLVLALRDQNFRIFNYFEERSAAFFALGLIKSGGQPVAIITTSGTASAELLPAAIEATYQGLPLILVTADRPKNYRGTGAPQTIEQVGLFSAYVDSVYDLDVNSESFDIKWSFKKPLQLNISFDEPLIDQAANRRAQAQLEKTNTDSELHNINRSYNSPLVILGELAAEHQQSVVEFIKKTKAPVYAESLSQLKNHSEIVKYQIRSSDALIKKIFKLKLCDSVIRIGGVPTLRFWRDLEAEFKDIPVLNYTDLPFSGLAKSSENSAIRKLSAQTEFQTQNLEKIKNLDEKLEQQKLMLLVKYPLSEQSFTNRLAKIVKTDAVYLGNSLPIRNWDQFAKCESVSVYANRGANGIDGQIATYLGWSQTQKKSYAYIGDLTALYDLAALGLATQLNQNQRNIIVLNNFGGQIFNRVFQNNDFINAHDTQFQNWAQMFKWNYQLITQPEELQKLQPADGTFNIIEVVPNNEQTQAFWDEWDELCRLV